MEVRDRVSELSFVPLRKKIQLMHSLHQLDFCHGEISLV